ncbi:MAG: peptidylprolyl isomerase [Ectothiorhodospiraceae bacterium]|nr:peptidylprolyl isomerase [Ectothiorhodospiraceae bacterium]
MRPPKARFIAATSAVLFTLMLGLGSTVAGQTLDRIVAVVNDDIILASELEAEIASVRQQYRGTGVRLPSGEELQRQVMERLVMKRLQLSRAERMGITVDDNTLNAAVRRVAEQNNMTLTQFQQALQREGISFARFREDLRDDIMISRLHQRQVERSVEVTEQEVDEYLASAAATEDLEYRVSHILIATPQAASPEQIDEARGRAEALVEELRGGADFAETAARVSDAANALEGGDLGWRSGGELPTVFQDVVRGMQTGQVSDALRSPSGFHIVKLDGIRSDESRVVTQTRARHILIRTSEVVDDNDARQRLESLRDRIAQGESFSALARAHSDDPGSASRGGDLGWANPGQFVPVFEDTMDALEPGQISQPFQTQFGWHILQVQERREHDSTEDYRRAYATQQIRERKSEETLEGWLRRMRDDAYVELRLDD